MAVVSRHAPDLRALGQVLRSLRREAGMTQEQLSFRTGMTTALISDAENGKRNLSFESVERILSALGVAWASFGDRLDAAAKPRKASRA